MAIFDERTRVLHLLRRAGLDASPTERERYVALGFSAAVEALLDYAAVPDQADDALAGLTLDTKQVPGAQRWWFARMVASNRPLQEKMVLFWHGHLTSAVSKVERADFMVAQNEFLRANALAPFDTIIKGITRDPAMLTYLDNRSSVKSAPNENYARELLELYTMGIGNYTEQDIREAARALTGMSVDRAGKYIFRQAQFDSGVKTFLGQTGPFVADQIIDIICRQPETPRFLSRQLFEFFAHPNPTDGEIQPMVDAYWSTSYSIAAMMRALFYSNAFSGDASHRSLIKSPTELVAGAYRALNIPLNERTVADGPRVIQNMGQRLLDPPDPSGWDGGPVWISTGNLLQRINYAAQLVQARDFDPVRILPGNLTDAAQIVDALLAALVDSAVSASTRATLVTEVQAAAAAGRTRRAIQLVLSLPEYQFA